MKMKRDQSSRQYVVCIQNKGYEASLERRKIYTAFWDETNEKQGLLRVLDESGEDYLYPSKYFRAIELPREIAQTFDEAA